MQTAAMSTPALRGRPRKADDERLSEVLRVRVTPDEADSLYKMAIRHGQPLNKVLRAVLKRLIARPS